MAVLLSQMLFSGCQLDNLVLINKIKEQLMAEKIRPPHLPTASAPSQQPLLAPSSHADGVQHGMSKGQQMPVLHSHSPSQPDVAVHPRSASSSVTGTDPCCSSALTPWSRPRFDAAPRLSCSDATHSGLEVKELKKNKNAPVYGKIWIQLFYSSQSEKVMVLKSTTN